MNIVTYKNLIICKQNNNKISALGIFRHIDNLNNNFKIKFYFYDEKGKFKRETVFTYSFRSLSTLLSYTQWEII